MNPKSHLRSHCVRFLLVALAFVSRANAADERTGEQIYQKQCASCHGRFGEGGKEYPRPLVGDKSIPQLSSQIAKTMPEDDPGLLKKDEADKVARFLYDTVYSKNARELNKPPRIELSRLTVGQYRNAIADLVGGFRFPAKGDNRRGLHGEYFAARGFQNDKRLIDRLDPEVNFDFGTEGPVADKKTEAPVADKKKDNPVADKKSDAAAADKKFDPHQFAIRWEGSVLAPETGEYEFIVRTDHAVRLWINDSTRPLIDAWVKSGSDNEFSGSIFLLGGKAYSLRLEFSKAKQGVDDSKKNMKEKPPIKASMALLWKQPKRPAEVISARNLSPNKLPEVFVVKTPFPPDDRSLGWERGTTVSKAWDQATTDAAIETAGYVATRLNELAGTKDGAADREAKARDFCKRFVERAFRRPLTDDQKKQYIDRQFEAGKETDVAVKRVVLLALKSPRFLYRETAVGSDPYDTAARLSFALWDALPDAELLRAAAEAKLATREQLTKQAERMLADPRAHAKLRNFLLTWLKVEHMPDLAKDTQRYLGFDLAIASDLRTSLELFLEEVLWSDGSDFRKLLLADELYLNGRLASFYKANLPADAPFQKVKLNPDQRAGALTHPYLMSAFAYSGSTSPIHRGVFVARGVLGLSMRPPPEAFAPLPEKMHPKLTTRERVALQTNQTACLSCHAIINPLGFTLEHFDAVGRFRTRDNDKLVDSSGGYQTRTGDVVKFGGIRDMAKYLAGSDEVHAAFAEQLFHHLVKQPVRAYGRNTLDELQETFEKNGFNMRKLAVEIAVRSALPPAPKPAIK